MISQELRTVTVIAAALLGGLSTIVDATPLSFYCITNESATDCAIGAAQLAVDVTSYGIGTGANGGDQVLFTFTNTGSAQSAISEVYFDNGNLLGIAGLIDFSSGGGDLGVDFTEDEISPVKPKNLPGANAADPDFVATAGFSAEPENPQPTWGVNPGESLGIIFDLQSGGDLDLVLYELSNGQIRIGMHVISFASGGSESFINNEYFPPSEVPVPAAVWLFGSGLLGMVGIARRKKAG